MNILDIKNRLRELNSQKFLSDEESEEKDRLVEELQILRNDSRKPEPRPQLVKIEPKVESKSKREHTVIGKAMISGLKAIAEHFKEKPVTEEEIMELKKKAVKYRLKADIEKSKSVIRKSRENRFGSISSPSKTRKYSRKENDVSDMLREAVKTKDINLWSKQTGKDIHKAFYG